MEMYAISHNSYEPTVLPVVKETMAMENTKKRKLAIWVGNIFEIMSVDTTYHFMSKHFALKNCLCHEINCSITVFSYFHTSMFYSNCLFFFSR